MHVDPSAVLRAASSPKGRLTAYLVCFLIFVASKLLANPSLADDGADDLLAGDEESVQSFADRHNCQIIYILGVEGAVHHGFTPILEKLAQQQVDLDGEPYVISYAHSTLRSALFGFSKETRPVDNPTLVRQVIRTICPHNGRKHVIIEDSSFPAGAYDDPRTYRIHRQPWWLDSSMEQIAMSDTALNHPTNLNSFYESYSQYADVKFVVLHRSYVEMVASHNDLDGTAKQHSNLIRGFLLLLRRFLDTLPTDDMLWTLVCIERITARFYTGNEEQMNFARRNIVAHLARFLGWPQSECSDCFSHWKDSDKNYLEVLGADGKVILEQMRQLGGIWPPVSAYGLPEHQCSL